MRGWVVAGLVCVAGGAWGQGPPQHTRAEWAAKYNAEAERLTRMADKADREGGLNGGALRDKAAEFSRGAARIALGKIATPTVTPKPTPTPTPTPRPTPTPTPKPQPTMDVTSDGIETRRSLAPTARGAMEKSIRNGLIVAYDLKTRVVRVNASKWEDTTEERKKELGMIWLQAYDILTWIKTPIIIKDETGATALAEYSAPSVAQDMAVEPTDNNTASPEAIAAGKELMALIPGVVKVDWERREVQMREEVWLKHDLDKKRKWAVRVYNCVALVSGVNGEVTIVNSQDGTTFVRMGPETPEIKAWQSTHAGRMWMDANRINSYTTSASLAE